MSFYFILSVKCSFNNPRKCFLHCVRVSTWIESDTSVPLARKERTRQGECVQQGTFTWLSWDLLCHERACVSQTRPRPSPRFSESRSSPAAKCADLKVLAQINPTHCRCWMTKSYSFIQLIRFWHCQVTHDQTWRGKIALFNRLWPYLQCKHGAHHF